MRGLGRFGATTAGFFIAMGCSFAPIDAEAVTRDNITVTVEPAPLGAFPASTPDSPRYGAYLFTLTNNTSSTLNNARFRADLSPGAEWIDSNPVQKDAAQCTRVTLQSIDCSVGYNGLIEKGGSVSFNIVLRTPTTGSVKLAWDVRPGDGTALGFISATEETSLAADTSTGDDAKVASVVPPGGFFIYTGVNNTPNANGNGDKYTTAANVYPVSGLTITTTITEGLPGATFPTIFDSPNVCPPTAKFCSNVSVDVQQPGLPPAKAKFPSTLSEKLIITLRIDAAYVAGMNINTTPIYYTSDDGTTANYVVPNCPSKRDSYVPTNDLPCVHARTVLNKKFGPDLAGDWQIEFFSSGNGMFAFD